MVCANGVETSLPPDGIYFICQKGDYEGNQCRFVRWCGLQHHYVMLDESNTACKDYSLTRQNNNESLPKE